MKANKQIIIDNIITEIEIGTPTENICATICTKFQFTERTFYNHYKIAQQQHSLKREAINNELMKVDTQFAIEARTSEILSTYEKKIILSKIAKGESISEAPAPPLWIDRIRAIAELNKMDGDYEATKTEIKIEPLVITGMVII